MQNSILIVEDDELTIQLFNDLLETHGYKPLPSRGGVEALELARLRALETPSRPRRARKTHR
jgi:CheY-like chemotaxis protein